MSDTDPAGWQPDPTGRHDHRYWDGSAWTDNVSDAGVASTDPFSAPATPDVTVADAPAAPVAPTPPADTTAAWSTAPGASVPPVPQAAASGGGNSSKKGLMIGGGILAVIAIIVAVLLLSGGDDDDSDDVSSDATTTTEESADSDVRADLLGALTNPDQGDLSPDDAECVADEVIDDVDGDVLAGIDYTAEDAPLVLRSALESAYETCNIGDGSTDDGSTDDGSSDDGGTDDGGTDDEDADEVLDQMATYYETFLGLTREQAECLVGVQSGDIADRNLSPAEAAGEIFSYLSECDISASDIVTGN